MIGIIFNPVFERVLALNTFFFASVSQSSEKKTNICLSTLRELCQTLVRHATKPKQHLCRLPFNGESGRIPQGTAKSFLYQSFVKYISMKKQSSKSVLRALQRCIYASCNCEKSEAGLCAVLSSYARACTSKGVFLMDWRENVCSKDFSFFNFSW